MDPAEPTELNLKQAAQRLGLHYMTVYRYVRSGRLPARRDGTAWVVDAVDLVDLVDLADPAVQSGPDHSSRPGGEVSTTASSAATIPVDPVVAVAPRPRVDHVGRMRERLVAGDECGAWAAAEAALVSGWDPEAVMVDLVSEAVRTIRSEHGDAAPHLAVVTATRVSASLGARFRRRGRARGTVVLGAPSGEAHWFGLAVIADVMRLRNFTVLELGGDVGAAAFVDAAGRADRLVAVGVGVTGAVHLPAAGTVIEAVRVAVPRVPVLLGGQAVASRELSVLSGADGWAPDARGLADLVEARVPKRTRPTRAAPKPVPALR